MGSPNAKNVRSISFLAGSYREGVEVGAVQHRRDALITKENAYAASISPTDEFDPTFDPDVFSLFDDPCRRASRHADPAW